MNQQSTVRMVIVVLGLLALAVVVGGIVLAMSDRALPGELIAIGSAAAGAVGGILSKTGDTDVRVVNAPDEPVPVEPDAPRRPLRADDRGQSTRVIAIAALIAVVALVRLL